MLNQIRFTRWVSEKVPEKDSGEAGSTGSAEGSGQGLGGFVAEPFRRRFW